MIDPNENPGWRALGAALILRAIEDTRRHNPAARDWLLFGDGYDLATGLIGLSTPVWIWRGWVATGCKGKPYQVRRKIDEPKPQPERRRKVTTNANQ